MRLKDFLLVPAGALALALLFGVMGSAAGSGPRTAEAAIDCSAGHRLRVDIFNDATNDLLTAGGASVRITPDPRDGSGSRTYVDQGSNDENTTSTGRIHEDDACAVSTPDQYSVVVQALPSGCQLVGSDTQTTTLTASQTVTFHVKSCLGADDVSILISSGSQSLGCSQRTDVSVDVKILGLTAVDGTAVSFTTDLGSVNPASATTTGGKTKTEYQSPSAAGGTATITVSVLGVSQTATISVACNLNVGPAGLGFPQASCGGSAAVTFYWGPNNAGTQFLDLTVYDNGFVPGTFSNSSGLSASTSQLTWNGLTPGLPYYWRINTLTQAGWVTSSTATFVPCGGPQLRSVYYTCTGGGMAAVTFQWSPPTPTGLGTWLDLSLSNNGFEGGTFINAGPMGSSWQNWTWNGIWANQTHYWRVDTLFSNGWAASGTGAFVAYC